MKNITLNATKPSPKLSSNEILRPSFPAYDPFGVHSVKSNTFFIKESDLNKLLGFEETRGRIYTKYSNLFRYKLSKNDKVNTKNLRKLCKNGVTPYICFWTDFEVAVELKYYHEKHFLGPYDPIQKEELKARFAFKLPNHLLLNIRKYLLSNDWKKDLS